MPALLLGSDMRQAQDLVARFWSKVDVRGPDECWPWLAAVAGDGYGRFSQGGRGAPQARASRFAYACENGPVPEGASVLHSCDNPRAATRGTSEPAPIRITPAAERWPPPCDPHDVTGPALGPPPVPDPLA